MDKEIEEYTSVEIETALADNIADYETWLNKQIPISAEWEEELNYLTFVRSTLDDLVKEADKRNMRSDKDALDTLDTKWKNWIKVSNQQFYDSIDFKKPRWWEHLTSVS